jgi:hypothetical protein
METKNGGEAYCVIVVPKGVNNKAATWGDGLQLARPYVSWRDCWAMIREILKIQLEADENRESATNRGVRNRGLLTVRIRQWLPSSSSGSVLQACLVGVPLLGNVIRFREVGRSAMLGRSGNLLSCETQRTARKRSQLS